MQHHFDIKTIYVYIGCDLSLGFPDVDMGTTMAELQVYVTTEFTCDGAITAWSLYAQRTGTVFLSVWRTTGPSKFQMVAKNELNVTETGYIVSYWNSIVTGWGLLQNHVLCSSGDVNTRLILCLRPANESNIVSHWLGANYNQLCYL